MRVQEIWSEEEEEELLNQLLEREEENTVLLTEGEFDDIVFLRYGEDEVSVYGLISRNPTIYFEAKGEDGVDLMEQLEENKVIERVAVSYIIDYLVKQCLKEVERDASKRASRNQSWESGISVRH